MLLYSNRRPEDRPSRPNCQALVKRNPRFHPDGHHDRHGPFALRPGRQHGHHRQYLRSTPLLLTRPFYASGPPALVEAMRKRWRRPVWTRTTCAARSSSVLKARASGIPRRHHEAQPPGDARRPAAPEGNAHHPLAGLQRFRQRRGGPVDVVACQPKLAVQASPGRWGGKFISTMTVSWNR